MSDGAFDSNSRSMVSDADARHWVITEVVVSWKIGRGCGEWRSIRFICKEQPAGNKQVFRHHNAVQSPEIVMYLSHSSVDAPNADLPTMRIYAWVSLWHWSNPIVTTDSAFQPAYMPCIAQCREDSMPSSARTPGVDESLLSPLHSSAYSSARRSRPMLILP